jgi:hypothetical protein
MRFTCFIGCGYVACDCFERAAGQVPQTMFAPDFVWMWWIPAVLWGISAVNALVWKLEI